MIPSISRQVVAKGLHSNGTDTHPAIITRVWRNAEPSDGIVLVNLVIFPDLDQPVVRGSVRMFETSSDANAWLATQADGTLACFWPDRV